jgi:hypothetical protein
LDSKHLQVIKPPRPPADTPNPSARVWCGSQLNGMDADHTVVY